MTDYERMYHLLFNAITDALEELGSEVTRLTRSLGLSVS